MQADGEKIAAIKLLREQTGMGLAEARDAVEGALRGEVIAAPAPAAAGTAVPIGDEVRRLAERGERIAAIRLPREQSGLGLKDAKDRIDAAFGPAPSLGAGAAFGVLLALAGTVAGAWLLLR